MLSTSQITLFLIVKSAKNRVIRRLNLFHLWLASNIKCFNSNI